jgi:hypothetical protein
MRKHEFNHHHNSHSYRLIMKNEFNHHHNSHSYRLIMKNASLTHCECWAGRKMSPLMTPTPTA